ncbi:hypothetical protein [Modestobacter lapidis]|nr:hypothetical protein [Modestobacter lapidis]
MSGQLLSTPLRLGPVALANRVVFAAHLTNAAVDAATVEGERVAAAL